MTGTVPDKIGKYLIKRKIGAGATSTVYLAEDAFFARDVAIKMVYREVLHDPVHGQRYRKLFLNEASLAGKLHHPHIATIYDAAVDSDSPYLVMEYVPGGTLEKYCRADTLLAYSDIVEIVFKCCRALEYAHRMGVIHRDIKPANIMLGEHTDIKITDFGTALSFLSEQTQVSGILGSPAYMSPEQVNEQPLNHQTDIYSLGVVMYQLLTGRLPFTADNQFSLLQKIANEPVPPVQQVRPEVPEALARTVERALEKKTEKRYKSWNEFSLDLTDAFARLEEAQDNLADTKKFDALRKLDFFRNFSEVELWELLRISSWKRFPPDRALVAEGNMGQSFYILASGTAKVIRGEKLLSELSAGDCFGEMAFIRQVPTPRIASVVSTSEVLLVKVKARALLEASENLQLRFNRKFLDILVDRLARTNDLVS
ncbi:MAG: serine/threonine-protein kinase [Acidiferrobacterales bacterium]|nr:serine/threonine-protein kinase [Acidiferrobacterales bacterium]